MVEWNLKFFVEAGEAELRFRHLVHTFQNDANVALVEISTNSTDPDEHRLLVRFKEGVDKPDNRRLHHCNQVYATTPITRKSRYERLLADDFFEDEG